jgi:hypothetical protein
MSYLSGRLIYPAVASQGAPLRNEFGDKWEELMIFDQLFRVSLPVSLLAAACGTAAAQSATTTVSPSPATLIGTVSIKNLASWPQAAQPARAPEMRQHLLPDGSLTSKQSRPAPGALPLLTPNVEVALSPEGAKGTPSTASVTSVKGFVGIHSLDDSTATGFELEPPDQGLAVNNNVAAEINNLMTDPQAFFDPATGRWFFTVVDFGFVRNLDIVVSTSSDPLGSYFIYQVRAFSDDLPGCAPFDCLPDYPKAGYDANGLYISVNLFGEFGFVAAATYALPKLQLEAGANVTPVRFKYTGDFVVQPSVPAPGEPFASAANGTEYLRAQYL